MISIFPSWRAFLFFVIVLICGAPQSALAEPRIERSLSNTGHGFALVSSPVRAGEIAHYFELRHGDCGRDRHSDDCKTDRSRTEVWLPRNQWRPGSVQWIGYSLYMPADFKPSDPVVTTAGQIHMQGGPSNNRGGHTSTPGVLLMNLDRYGYTGCVIKISGPRNSITDECIHVDVASLAQMRGRWTDVQIGFDTTQDGGVLEIWANDRLVKRVEGFHPYTANRYYFKYGIYRSFVSRFNGTLPTQILLFDEIKFGENREQVRVDVSAAVN